MHIGLGISTYNGPFRVDELLRSIEEHTKYPRANFKIIVIDDGSREDNLLRLRNICANHEVPLREHRQNLGISTTWNHLTQFFEEGEEKIEYMVISNDDIIVTDNWLTSLIFFLENNKCGGAGLPLIFGHPKDETAQILGHEGRHIGPTPGRVMAAPGCLFGFKRSLFDEIGGFDEHYKSFYEEIHFGTECAMRGYPSYALSYPRVYHLWSATFAQNPELQGAKRMSQSRQYYKSKWEGDTDVTHPRYMCKIPPQKIKWWMPFEPHVITTWDIDPKEWESYWQREYKIAFTEEWKKMVDQ